MTENINQSKDTDNTKNSMVFLQYIKIIVLYKKFILFTTFIIGLIVAILVFFVIKPTFYSAGTIKTSGKSSVGLSGMLSGGNVPDIGGLGELASGGSLGKELALFENIIMSRRCLEEAIIKFNLLEVWNIKYMQDALKFFREEILLLNKDKIAGTIEIGIYDTDPVRAKDISDFLILQLDKINTEMNIQNAKSNREFIESRYKVTLVDLKKAEDSLRDYQDRFGVAPDVQVKAAAQSEMQLEVDIKSEQVKLELLRKILSPDQAEIKQQEDRISALQNQLSQLQNSTESDSKLKLKGTPEIVMNYFRLSRDVEIQNKILITLLPIFEQAKIEEKRETPSVIVLDTPFIPEHKVKPKRITSILISILFTFIITSAASVFYHTIFNRLRQTYREI